MGERIPDKYLKMEFTVTPRKLFTARELRILEHYGPWMRALMTGEIAPATSAQERFIRVALGEESAESEFEKVWAKYVARKKWERENPDYAGVCGVREADPGWAGHYRPEFQNGGYMLARKKYED